MILQLTAKSTGVQNLIRTNTHIPYSFATERANKNRTLHLILKLDLTSDQVTAAAVDMKLKNGLLSATKWLVDWITPLLSANMLQYLCACAMCECVKSGM